MVHVRPAAALLARAALALAASALVALSVAACGSGLRVSVVVPVPPDLPVRAFPEIIVILEGLPEEIEVAEAIAAHLAASAGSSRIERLDEARLAMRRAQGALGPASIVLHVEVRMVESLRSSWTTRPETVCGPWGCATQQRTVMIDVPQIDATAVLHVSEARSGQPLQDLPLREHDESGDAIGMRMRALMRLRERAIAAIDPGRVVLAIELAPVDDAAVRAALDAIRGGHPGEARRALERIAARDDFGARRAEDRAKILFDLGQARRLEARTGEGLGEVEREARLGESEEAIRGAIRIDPQPIYARALAQIDEERQAAARMRTLEEAASHNFALQRGGSSGGELPPESVPEPPPGYGDTTTVSPPP